MTAVYFCIFAGHVPHRGVSRHLRFIRAKIERSSHLERFALSKKLLETVATEVKGCEKCLLWKTRKNAVPGEGSAKSRIMFIGEAPGRSEDLAGRPFVGAAGKFLEALLLEAELQRTEVFICNVLKCRPPENRQPRPDEVQTCAPFLDRQIKIVKPKVIATLGNHATAYMFSKAGLPFEGITVAHGKPRRATILEIEITLFPTFHPAAALYNGEYKRQLVEDFKLLKKELSL